MTTRFFVDKLPIADGSPVQFCYVDPGYHSTVAFEGFLVQYRPLFTALSSVRLTYFAGAETQFDAVSRLFRRIMPGSGGSSDQALEAYFAARLAFETRDMKAFDQDRLIQFREDRRRFAGQHFEEQFEHWKQGRPVDSSTKFDRKIELETRLAPAQYQLFGTLSKAVTR